MTKIPKSSDEIGNQTFIFATRLNDSDRSSSDYVDEQMRGFAPFYRGYFGSIPIDHGFLLRDSFVRELAPRLKFLALAAVKNGVLNSGRRIISFPGGLKS